jgi:CrcB protein
VARHIGDEQDSNTDSTHDHRGLSEFEEFIGGRDGLPVDPDAPAAGPAGTKSGLRGVVDDPVALVAVFIGGFFGTLGRYEFSLAWPERVRTFPVTTFIVNVSGALLIGVILTTILELLAPHRYLRQLLCVGLLGGWTTMSTLAVESDHLFGAAAVAIAFGYLASSVLAGTVACATGISLVRRLRSREPAGLGDDHADPTARRGSGS